MGETSVTEKNFDKIVNAELLLDVELFKKHLTSSALRDAVRSDLNKAKELGLTGTPTFYLNGEKMEIKTFEDFIGQIAFAIDPTAAPLNASGTPATGESEVKFGI